MLAVNSKVVLWFAAVLHGCPLVVSDVIDVPGDYPTIQEAIGAAKSGDLIEVAAGIYPERINTAGKAIQIRGSVDSSGTPVTILDGQAGGSVVTVDSGEGYDTVIENLLLRNGLANRGGGAYVDFNSRARFENCHFIGNQASWGGGFCSWGSRLVGCRVEGNRCTLNLQFNASGVLRFDGINGGILHVEDCIITGNGTPGQVTYAIGVFGDGQMDVSGTTVCGNLNGECMGFDCQGPGNYVDEDCIPPACPQADATLSINSSLDLSERGNRCECIEPDFSCGSYAGEWAVVYDLSQGEAAGRGVILNCVRFGTYNDDAGVAGKIHLRVDTNGGDPVGRDLVDLASFDINIPTASSAMNLLVLDPPVEIPADSRLVLSLESDWAFGGYMSISGNESPSQGETFYRDPQTFCSSNFLPIDNFGFPDLNWVTEIGMDFSGDPPCLADFNADGRVDGADLPTVLSSWGQCRGDCPADIDGNGVVNGADLSAVLSSWGLCP